MLFETTPGTERALSAASDWTARLQQAEMGPRELLLGLLEEEEGRPVYWLKLQRVDPNILRVQLVGELPILEGKSYPGPNPHREPIVLQLLPQARILALKAQGQSTIASEHLMAALLRHYDSLRNQVETAGFNVSSFEKQIGCDEDLLLALDEPLMLPEPVEVLETSRILDANGNRSREALRVIEDYCRFVLSDAWCSKQCKQLRHDLTAALNSVTKDQLLQMRDTDGDVGTRLTLSSEYSRSSSKEVLIANFKRLQESLRSLEEFGKRLDPRFGAMMESCRYRSYSLEKSVLSLADAATTLRDASLYMLVSSELCVASIEWTVQEAAAGGVQIIQLREKKKPDREIITKARELRELTSRLGLLFIVNDRPEIARIVHADGVHLGQDDLRVAEARRILGPTALIGVSTHSPNQVEQAIQDGASYIGVGPLFSSGTKQFDHFPGLEFARWTASQTALPAFGIGGIDLTNIEQIVETGLRRVAVGSAIAKAADPKHVAATMRGCLAQCP